MMASSFAAAAGRLTATTAGAVMHAALAVGAVGSLHSLHHHERLQCEASATKPVNLKSRMTAIGHFSILSETVHNPSIVTFVMTLTGREPLTVADFCQVWRQRAMQARHPRFHLGVSTARAGYFETRDDDSVEGHVSESLAPVVPRTDVLERIRALQMAPWNLSEALWHVYLVPWNTYGRAGTIDVDSLNDATTQEEEEDEDDAGRPLGESLLFFRGHHVLADGASMGAALLDLSDEAQEFREAITREVRRRRQRVQSLWQRWYRQLQRIVWLVGGSVRSLLYQLKLYADTLWETNPCDTLEALAIEASRSGGGGNAATPLPPQRTVSFTTAAPVDQAKWMARTLGGERATINDLFVTAVTAALMRQLDVHRKRLLATSTTTTTKDKREEAALPRQRHIHIAVPVHLKGGVVLPGESVGNNIGAFCVQLPGENDDLSPAERFEKVHKEMNAVKRTPAPLLANLLAKLTVSILPSGWAASLYSRSAAGATCVITNVRGPPKEIHIQGRTVESIYGFVPLPPGIPAGVVVSSYAGKMKLTLTAQAWAIPDGDQFLAWVLEEYLVLLQAAKQKEAATERL